MLNIVNRLLRTLKRYNVSDKHAMVDKSNFNPTHEINISGCKVTIDASKLSNKLMTAMFRGNYEKREVALINKVLDEQDKVLELGSGIGLTAVAISKIVAEGNIRSYEANPDLLEWARYNANYNDKEIDFRNEVLTHGREKVIPFFVAKNFWASSLVRIPDKRLKKIVEVPCSNINDVIKEFSPNALVLDIEGGEIEILENSNLDGINKILMETHYNIRGEKTIDDMIARLTEKGFRNDLSSSVHQIVYLRKH